MRLILLCQSLVCASLIAGLAGASPSVTRDRDQQRVTVRCHPTASDGLTPCVELVAGTSGAHVIAASVQGWVVANLDGDSVVSTLRQHPNVASVQADVPREHIRAIAGTSSLTPSSTLEQQLSLGQVVPTGIVMVGGNRVDDRRAGDIGVCLIDTGCDGSHPDLAANNISVSTVRDTGLWYNDTVGHGTHVAGTLLAINNGIGVVGMLPAGRVRVHVIKMFQADGDFSYASSLVEAVNRCVTESGARVINLSLGGGVRSDMEEAAFASLADQVLVIAAAGNSGSSDCAYPACYPSVLAVAAVDADDQHADFSNHNAQVDLCAPGVDVLSTYPRAKGSYAIMSGTSMAAPHVTGSAALMWSFHPLCNASEIREALVATALDLGDAGHDQYYGHGLVRLVEAKHYLDTHPCLLERQRQGTVTDTAAHTTGTAATGEDCQGDDSDTSCTRHGTCCPSVCSSISSRQFYANYYCV